MTVYLVAVAVDEPRGGIEAQVVAKALEKAGLNFNAAYVAAAVNDHGFSPEFLEAFRTLGFSDAHATYLSGAAVAPPLNSGEV